MRDEREQPVASDMNNQASDRLHNPYVRRRDRRGLYYEHRAIAEWKLGRALRDGEVVHHCNGDKQDNHPENIWVFSTHRAHMLYEHYLARQQLGVGHLFEIEEVLEWQGEWVLR